MAFSADGKRLATGGGSVITIWPCTGKTGPEGVTPVQLDGHDGEVLATAFSPKTGQLATGDGTGMVLIFTFHGDKAMRKRLRLDGARHDRAGQDGGYQSQRPHHHMLPSPRPDLVRDCR